MTTIATHTKSTIMPGLRYQDAAAAIEWLCNVLGFERHAVYPGPDGTIGHAELTLNGGMVMLGSQKDDGMAEDSSHRKSWATLRQAVSTSSLRMLTPFTNALRQPAQ